MIKKFKKISLILILFILILMLKSTNVFATTSQYYEDFRNYKCQTTYTLYLGERMNAIDSNIFYGLHYDNNAKLNIEIKDTNIVDRTYNEIALRGKKVGTTKVTVTLNYNGAETLSKTFEINVKQTSSSTTLDSKVNDVVDVVSSSNKKTEILLANSELWSLDNTTFKPSKKQSGNVENYVYSSVYYEESDNQIENVNIIQKLKKNSDLYAKSGNTEKKVEDVKQISDFGFLKKNGDFYMYTYKGGKFGYTKKATKVSALMGNLLYVKGGKTYTIYGMKIFDFEIKSVAKDYSTCGSGLVLNKKGEAWEYIYDYNSKKYITKKQASNVKELIGGTCYKTNSNKIVNIYGPETNICLDVFSLSGSNNSCWENYLELRVDNKVYLNDIKILDNAVSINRIEGTNNTNKALIVRKDGSIWKLEIGGKASLTKVRSGNASAKKISTPTNVKTAKSGSKYIKVSWTKVDGATKYTIYRATSKDGSYKNIGTTTGSSYTDKKSTVGKTYYYKVVANYSNSDYSSSRSSAVKIKIPKTPTSLKVSKKSTTSMKVSYKKSSGVTGYQIVYSTSKDFKNSKTKEIEGTSVTIKSLNKKKTYYVKVRAYQTINGKKVYSSYTKAVKVSLK